MRCLHWQRFFIDYNAVQNVLKGMKTMAHTKPNKAQEEVILEYFQMGKNANEVYELMNRQTNVIGRTSVYRRFTKWQKAGSPGLLTLVSKQRLDDGTVVLVYQDKQGKTWTSQGNTENT
jgi:hypothetical protein